MIVKIENNGLANGKYTNEQGEVWSVARLIEHAKDLPVFDIPVSAIHIGRNVFDDQINNPRRLAEHVKRVIQTASSWTAGTGS